MFSMIITNLKMSLAFATHSFITSMLPKLLDGVFFLKVIIYIYF